MTSFVLPIVEGYSELNSLERLLHRVWGEILSAPTRLQVLEAFRGKRDLLIKDDGVDLQATIQKAFIKLHSRLKRETTAHGLILVLLDAEKSLPCLLAPSLLNRLPQFEPATRVQISCVLANRMFENWIVAGCGSLAGRFGFPSVLSPPDDTESVGGKGWIKERLREVDPSRSYSETVDAVTFIQEMDVVAAHNQSRSFQKLCKELLKLLAVGIAEGEGDPE